MAKSPLPEILFCGFGCQIGHRPKLHTIGILFPPALDADIVVLGQLVFPIRKIADQRDPFYGKPGLEQVACALLAQAVEMLVPYTDILAGPPERSSGRG